jgi:3-dehydroshikimate dehydratase
MMILTAFADEISPDFDVQLDTLDLENIKHIEFRGAWNKGVLQLTDKELDLIEQKMEQRGFHISSIGSPIGKIRITDDFEPHLKDFDRAISIAKRFNVPYIRIFSFFLPEGEDPAIYRDEVMRRMTELLKRAEESEITLLHENEKHIYGDNAERCLDLFENFHSPRLRCAFDPANFVQCGIKPYTDAFPLLEPYIEYIHIKDALASDHSVVPSGDGDGQVTEILKAVKSQGYEGFLSLEPHLVEAGTFSGFSGPDLFQVASKALKNVLADINEEWK